MKLTDIVFPVFILPRDIDIDTQDGIVFANRQMLDDLNVNHDSLGMRRLRSSYPTKFPLTKAVHDIPSFLKSAAKELDITWPKYKTLDTVTIARQVLTKEEVPNCKLQTLAAYFGTKAQPNHRALDDALATTEILHALLERLGSFDVNTVESLMEFAKTAAHVQRQNYWGLSST